MLKDLVLENWKSHYNSKISFFPGTNIIVGKVGAGKSSIIDAICYALYGTFPAIATRKLSLAECIMFKPIKKENARVTLSFFHNNNLYRVERELFQNKTNSAKLYQNERLIAGPKQTDVNNKISELLEIDYDLFIKIIYSEQNEMDFFLKIPPGERKEKFDSLFGINNLENIKINSRELVRLISSDLNTQSSLHSQLEKQISLYNLQEIKEDLSKISQEKQEKEKALSSLLTQKQTLEKEFQAQKEKKQIFEKNKTDINNLLFKQKEINLKLKPQETTMFSKEQLLEKQINLEKKLKETEEANTKVILSKKTLENQHIFYIEQLSLLTKEINEKTSKLISLSQEPILLKKQQLEEKHTLLQEKKLKTEIENNNLNKAIEELKKGFSRCPVCDSTLSREQLTNTLNEKQEDFKISSDLLKTLTKELLTLEDEKLQNQKQEQLAKTNETYKQQIQELSLKQEGFKTKKQEIETNQKQLPPVIDLSILKEEQKQLLFLIEQENLLLEKKQLEEKLLELNTKQSSLGFLEENYLETITTFKNLENTLNFLISQKQALEKQEEMHLKNLNTYNTLKQEQENITTKINTLKQNTLDLSYFTTSLEISQNQLRKVIVDNINKTLEIIWPKIYTYGDYISARLNTTETKGKNDYLLEVLTKENEWTRVEGILSGGERTCAALSIRIAVALSLTKNLKLLILDEPTHNLDSSIIQNFSNILEKELPDLVEQVFIITHDNTLLKTTNTKKFRIERDKENNGVSQIKEE